MNTLSKELRSTIMRHVEIADRRDIAVIAAALCEKEIADEAASGDRTRPAQAAEPAGQRFEISGDTVRDNSTGLVWTRGNVSDKRLEWKDAKEACEKLELDGGGWRLPTIKELLTLVDYERHSPAIDPAFTCESAWYWTATSYAPSPGVYAWLVLFSNGSAVYYDRGGNGFVRAVRGGQ